MLAAFRTLVCTLTLGATAFGAGFSFTGNFLNDNDLQFFQVNMAADGVLTIQTYGYAGGLNQAGNTILPGGFAPAIAVFDPVGDPVGGDNLGGSFPDCNGRGIDPTTGFCFDAIVFDFTRVPLFLTAGLHTVVLTQQGNNALGALADGFQYDTAHFNDPSFTGTTFGQPGQKFVDPSGLYLRSSAWAVDFVSDSLRSVSAVPEPGTVSLMLLSGLGIAAFARSRRKN